MVKGGYYLIHNVVIGEGRVGWTDLTSVSTISFKISLSKFITDRKKSLEKCYYLHKLIGNGFHCHQDQDDLNHIEMQNMTALITDYLRMQQAISPK